MSDRYVFEDVREQEERRECHENTPLQLTDVQRARLLALLTDELGGPHSALRVLRRIEETV